MRQTTTRHHVSNELCFNRETPDHYRSNTNTNTKTKKSQYGLRGAKKHCPKYKVATVGQTDRRTDTLMEELLISQDV